MVSSVEPLSLLTISHLPLHKSDGGGAGRNGQPGPGWFLLGTDSMSCIEDTINTNPPGSRLLIRSVLYGVSLGKVVRVSHAGISGSLLLIRTARLDGNPSFLSV
jgi:hypothetical protein